MIDTKYAIVAGLCCAYAAQAGSIEYSDIPQNTNHADLLLDGIDIDVDSSPRDFIYKTTNGTTGVGVKHGSVNGEIDNDEYIEFTFETPVYVTSFSVGQLYASGNFGDNPDEVAMLLTSDAGSFELTVTSETTATWSGAGLASNVSIANNSGGGEWLVSGGSLFGAPVTSVKFASGNPGGGQLSDYTFVSMGFRKVPAPGTLAISGIAGCAFARRRRR